MQDSHGESALGMTADAQTRLDRHCMCRMSEVLGKARLIEG